MTMKYDEDKIWTCVVCKKQFNRERRASKTFCSKKCYNDRKDIKITQIKKSDIIKERISEKYFGTFIICKACEHKQRITVSLKRDLDGYPYGCYCSKCHKFNKSDRVKQ